LNGFRCIVHFKRSSKKTKKTCKINGYRRLKTVTGIKMGTFVKKNKLNNSSKWFTFWQKIRS